MNKILSFISAHKKIGYQILTIFLIFLFVSTCSFSMEENLIQSVSHGNADLTSFGQNGYAFNIFEDGNVEWVPFSEDPHVNVSAPDFEVNKIEVTFNEPFKGRTAFQLFYIAEGEGLQEENSYKFDIEQGQSTISFYIPSGEYSLLRMDIDGPYSPKEMIVSNTQLIPTRNFEIVPFVTLAILLVVLIVLNSRIAYFAYLKSCFLRVLEEGRTAYLQKKWIGLLLYLAMCVSTCIYVGVLTALLLLSTLTVKTVLIMFWLTVVTVGFQLLYRLFSNQNAEPAKLFLVVALLIGFLFAYAVPITTGIAWDDQIHYYRTELTSRFLFGHQRTLADYAQAVIVYDCGDSVQQFDETVREMVIMDQESYHERGHIVNFYVYIAYLHNSFLIILCDIFSIDFILQMTLMKMANAAIYAFVIYRGIKKLKSGAYLASAICLMPTAMFLASTINYDWWVTCFLIYGFSGLISELQQPEKTLSFKEAAYMLWAMFLGCGPKAIYFLLLLPFLFLSKKKFNQEKDYRKYKRTCIILAGVIMLSFVLPFLINTDASTDIRGGSDVNSSEQLKFILTSPFQYAKILIQFMITYLSPQSALNHAPFWAYLGGLGNELGIISVGLIVFCAFVDKKECDAFPRAGWFNFATFLTVIIDVALIATALYVSFTPVRHETINGCQWRYLIPLLFPMFYSFGGRCAVRTMSDRKMGIIVFGLLFIALVGSFYDVYATALIS